jgi:predicted O-methyltransferase YrrM
MTKPPALVTRARALANALGFEQSCEDAVGRLLSVLAAAVPSRGRILEIGTGCGVGLAWICDGAGSDVEIVSIESHRSRAAATRRLGWPATVRLVEGDALAAIATLGIFDLIFADAKAGKWHGLDTTVNALRPGGILIVDDMRVGHDQPPDVSAAIASVRSGLYADPRLSAVELDWSSGVMLAVRIRDWW